LQQRQGSSGPFTDGWSHPLKRSTLPITACKWPEVNSAGPARTATAENCDNIHLRLLALSPSMPQTRRWQQPSGHRVDETGSVWQEVLLDPPLLELLASSGFVSLTRDQDRTSSSGKPNDKSIRPAASPRELGRKQRTFCYQMITHPHCSCEGLWLLIVTIPFFSPAGARPVGGKIFFQNNRSTP